MVTQAIEPPYATPSEREEERKIDRKRYREIQRYREIDRKRDREIQRYRDTER
jgi:hypothetical protein